MGVLSDFQRAFGTGGRWGLEFEEEWVDSVGLLAWRAWRSDVLGVESGLLFQSGRSSGCCCLNQFWTFGIYQELGENPHL